MTPKIIPTGFLGLYGLDPWRGQRNCPSGDRLWSVDLAQRTGLVREIACAQCLHAGVVLTVERRDCARAADCGCVLRRVKPQAQMVHLHGIEGWVLGSIREGRTVEYLGSRRHIWRHGKGLDAEAPDERAVGVTGAVAFQVTLVPGDSKCALGT
jgi:hypothetical protein